MKYTLEQFKKDVIQWSTDRMIIQNGSIAGQIQKIREECAEVSNELQKLIDGRGNIEELKKEIGDIAVILVNVDYMQDSGSDYYFGNEDFGLDHDYQKAIQKITVIFSEMAYSIDNYDTAWSYLTLCCSNCGVEISECAYLAFKKIEHRKGYFCKESMSFIKESDVIAKSEVE